MLRRWIWRDSEGEVKEQYQVTIKNKFAALEILENNGDINRGRDTFETTSGFWPKRVSVIMN
jgi:hypothetical protein